MSSIDVNFLRDGNPGVFDEVVTRNGYGIQKGCFKGQLVIDFGAHIGTFAYMAHSLGEAERVVCVEPNPRNYERLERCFGGHHQFFLENRAASRDYTPVRISDSDNVSTTGSVGHLVNSVPLQEFVHRFAEYRGKATLKCDIGGGEYDVLWTCHRKEVTFFNTILLETHDSVERHLAMNEYLKLFGYKISSQLSSY